MTPITSQHRHHRRRILIDTTPLFICASLLLVATSFVHSTKHLERFSHPEIEHYGQLHFDPSNFKLIVGARDYILTLGLESFDGKTKRLYYSPAEKERVDKCTMKGMPTELCHNFITAILPIPESVPSSNPKVLVCGTKAFSPECETRLLGALEMVNGSAATINAYSPHWNTSSYIASNGQFFYAGPLDFRGIDSSVTRQAVGSKDSSPQERKIVRSHQSDFKWINTDANFVSSFEHDEHVYFLFRETAIEYMNVGKRVYSRLARVCKNDPGARGTWTSFLKTRLSCSMGGDFPFYFDEIQSVQWIDNKLYAVFNTPRNSIHGSAICSFTADAIDASFNGRFKYQRSTNQIWEAVEDSREAFECRSNASTLSNSVESSTERSFHHHRMNSMYQLMDSPVQASEPAPLVVSRTEHFKFIAVDLIRTQHHETVEVMFVTTTDGKLLKYVRWPNLTEPCLVDEQQLTVDPQDEILTMKLLKDTQSLYFGTRKQVIRVPLHQCAQHKTRDVCLASGDPYCGWNESKMKCTKAPGDNHRDTTWRQLPEPVCTNQRWSRWVECSVASSTNTVGQEQTCQCRNRPCVNSQRCIDGLETQVANCTQHGQWSDWTAWSSCAPSCGRGFQQRTRSCTNPAPANGGRGCSGNEREVRECQDLPFCRWTDWSEWSNCTCGTADVRQRSRGCLDFQGNPVDESFCRGQKTETLFCDCKQQQWTEWFIAEVKGAEAIEQRVELNTDADKSKREKRVTPLQYSDSCDGFVYSIKHRDYVIKECKDFTGGQRIWSDWSSWTSCTNGTQRRARACLLPGRNCQGNFEEARLCNIFKPIVSNDILYSGMNTSGWSGISVFILVLFVIILTSGLTGAVVLVITRKRLDKQSEHLSGSDDKLGNLGLIRPYQNSEPNTYEEPEKYRILTHPHPMHHNSNVHMSTLTRHSSTLKKQTSFKAKLDDCNYN